MTRGTIKGLLPNPPRFAHVWELQQTQIRNSFRERQFHAALELLVWLGLGSASWVDFLKSGHAFGFLRAQEHGWIEKFADGGATKWRVSMAGAILQSDLEKLLELEKAEAEKLETLKLKSMVAQ